MPDDLDHLLPSPRFRVLRKLGSGTAGAVYEAFDQTLGHYVAAKVLAGHDAWMYLAVKSEYRKLGHVRHPNVVRVFDMFADGPRAWMTMEVLSGTAFPGDGPGSAVERALRALPGLVDGLEALHAQGILHRDVKPSNVLVDEKGHAVLVDFGLAAGTSRVATLPDQRRITGTFAYMAPEMANKSGSGPEADWWSVGALLYEALHGQNALDGEGIGMWSRPPHARVSPDEVEGATPEAILTALVRGLMNPGVPDRWGGREIRAMLHRLGHAAHAGVVRAPQPRFTGRAAEIGQLARALGAADSGTGRLARVVGVVGAGKSALLSEFARRATDAGALVFEASTHPREHVAYRALDGAMDSLARHVGRLLAEGVALDLVGLGRVGELFPSMRAALAHVKADGDIQPGSHDDRQRRSEVFRALRDLLWILYRRGSVPVFVLDDVQWADLDSLDLIGEVFHPRLGPPSLLVLAYTPDAVHGSAFLAGLDAVLGEVPCDVVTLSPLRDIDVRQIVRSLLGDEVPLRRLDDIVRTSAGDPALATWIGKVSRTWPSTGEFSVDELVAGQLARLDAESRDAFRALALAREPLPYDVLRALVGDETFAARLHELEDASLVAFTGDDDALLVRPTHERVSEASLVGLDEASRQRLHLRLAEAMRASGVDAAVALVDHLLRGGDHAGAVAEAIRGADRKVAELKLHRAAELYQRALDLTPADDVRASLCVRLGATLAALGHGSEAATCMLEAASLIAAADPQAAQTLRREASEQLLRVGDPRGEPVLAGVLQSLGVRWRATMPGTLISWLGHRMIAEWVRRLGRIARRKPRASDDERLRALWGAGVGLAFSDFLRAFDFQARHGLLAERVDDPAHRARATTTEAMLRMWQGGRANRKRALFLLETGEMLGAQVDDPAVSAQIHFVRCGVAWSIQRYEACVRTAIDGVRIGERGVSASWEIGNLQWLRHAALATLGDFARLRETLFDVLADADGRHDVYWQRILRVGWVHLVWVAADEIGEAEDALARAKEMTSPTPFVVYQRVLAEVRLALYLGDVDRADRELTAAWPVLDSARLLSMQWARIEMLELKATVRLAQVATATDAARRRAIGQEVAKIVRTLSHERDVDLAGITGRIESSWEAHFGDPSDVAGLLERAAHAHECLGQAAFAATCRFVRATWTGVDVEAARARLTWIGVTQADHFARVFCPMPHRHAALATSTALR